MIKARHKTLRLFAFAQLGIVFVLSIVIVFATLRLNEVRDVLEGIANNEMNQISRDFTRNNQFQILASRVNLLSVAQTNPARKLAKLDIEKTIDRLATDYSQQIVEDEFFAKRLNVLNNEINQLDKMVTRHIRSGDALDRNLRLVHQKISDLMLELNNQANVSVGVDAEEIMEVLLLTVKIKNQDKLHELRRIEEQLKNLFDSINNRLNAQASSSQALTLKPRILDIQLKLINETGLVNQKISRLRALGRMRGRQSFVSNLLNDVSSYLQYQTQLSTSASIDSAEKSSAMTDQYTRITIISGIGALLLSVGIIFFTYKRLISRLIKLSAQVESAVDNKHARIQVSGQDEITALAKAFSSYLRTVQEQEDKLLEMTLTDPLTGIPNRRAFENHIQDAISIARRNEWPMTIMFLDVDFFKDYNDHYGHSDGDACLKLVANQLNEIVSRNTDFCARYGGEEFVCILPNTSADGAKTKAEELRKAIETLAIPHSASKIADVITISIGVATFPFKLDSNWRKDVIVEQADKALYQAKAAGRNCCKYFSAVTT
ncbi:MAG: GGDEF domain-containing protein [Pseudomonadota bacterium]